MQPPGGKALLAQKPLDHTATRELIFHVESIAMGHQFEIIVICGTRIIVQVVPADLEKIGLTCEAQLVVLVGRVQTNIKLLRQLANRSAALQSRQRDFRCECMAVVASGSSCHLRSFVPARCRIRSGKST